MPSARAIGPVRWCRRHSVANSRVPTYPATIGTARRYVDSTGSWTACGNTVGSTRAYFKARYYEDVEGNRRARRERYHADIELSRERGRRKYAKRRDKALAHGHGLKLAIRARVTEVKMASGCQDCEIRPSVPSVLEFDHVRGVKDFNLGSALSYSMARVEAEMAKCDVICVNCHRIRTHNQRDALPQTNSRRDAGRAYVIPIKMNARCLDCGMKPTIPSVMDFDHVRGDKEFLISNALAYGKARLAREIAKCDIVCSNCHRIRTHNRRKGD